MTVFILGLDGASLENIRPVMSRTNLPNFKKVLEKGRAYNLRSIYPYVTAPAWTSIFSGVNPGKHGIFDMLESDGASTRAPNMRNCDIPFLWDYLSWADKKVLVMGVPFIYPAPTINGIFVTGRFSPHLYCYPDKVKKDVDLSGFDYSDPNLAQGKRWKFIRKFGLESLAELEIGMLRRRATASIRLVDSTKWDAVMLVDGQPDELFHVGYKDKGIVEMLFQELDKWLGDLLARLTKGDQFLIISDHGFSEVHTKFYLNEWLRLNGYVAMKGQTRLRILRKLDQGTSILDHSTFGKRARRLVLRKFSTALGLDGESSQKIQFDESNPEVGSRVIPFSVHEQVAWLKILPEKKEFRTIVTRSLMKDAQDLKKEGHVKNVFQATDLYHGKHMFKVPGDILIEFEDGFSLAEETNFSGKLIGKPNTQRHGTHRLKGLLVFYGGFAPKIDSEPCLYDIVPTVLRVMKLPIPKYIDGKPMSNSNT